MRGIIYDNYGVYPKEIENLKFTYGGNIYYIFITDKTNDEVKMLLELNNHLEKYFGDRIGRIIPNKSNKFVTKYLESNLIIIKMNHSKITIKDVVAFHNAFKQQFSQYNFKIEDLLALWEKRFEYIEKDAVPAIRADTAEYNTILEAVFFGYGLAENALSYLADIKEDLGNVTISPTITHLRFPFLDCLTFFNPLNFYLDHSCRDLADLYCNKIIDLTNLETLLVQYQYNVYDASLLMARILYPSSLFDLFEDLHIQKSDIRRAVLLYHQKIKDQLTRIRNAHLMLIKQYQIRPINWLIDGPL